MFKKIIEFIFGSKPSSVNDQITDAVTQAAPKIEPKIEAVVAEAEAKPKKPRKSVPKKKKAQ